MERHFDEELNALRTRLLLMGGQAEAIIHKAVDALQARDSTLAESVFEDDRKIDALEIEIDEQVIKMLALRQPVGTDLRFVTSTLKICNDLERVGDHAVNISQSTLRLVREPELRSIVDIPKIALLSTNMLTEALDAFVHNDANAARRILTEDDEVDHLKGRLHRELVTCMAENPRCIPAAMELILVSRNLERVADLATNMAEEVVYIAEARVVKHHMEERGAH